MGGCLTRRRFAAHAARWFNSTVRGVTKPGPETKLVERMRVKIKRAYPHAWIVKVHGGSYQASGIPDLVVVVNGLFIGIEAKAQGRTETEHHARERATPTQRATMAKIDRAQGVAGVALTPEEALEIVESAVKGEPLDPLYVVR